jgi:hypothetical protein
MMKGLRPLVQLMLARQEDPRTTGLVHSDQVVRDEEDPKETGTIVFLPDPPSPHPGKRSSLADAGN